MKKDEKQEKGNDELPVEIERSVRLEAIRTQLGDLRHEIRMMRAEDKLWDGYLMPCEGGITCVITTAHEAAEQMRAWEKKWGKKA